MKAKAVKQVQNAQIEKNSVEEEEVEEVSGKDASSKLSVRQKIVLSVCGAIIGFVNGFFGGGGGMICVPLLEKVLHLPNKYSHATAIAIIFPISFVSAIIYILSGSVQTVNLLTVGSGVLLGGVVGSVLLKFLPAKIVRLIFVGIMLFGGIRLIL